MISVIVYGRNDQHGANLHRRAALSLNSLAEALGGDDEIVFVDMRTPDAAPTFPEAIDDLLTERAIERLRVIRVREKDLAHLALPDQHIPEALARNIGARRAHGQWLLFTNTDVLLVEPQPEALRTAVAAAGDALHQAPRYDLPQYLWEMLPRDEPAFAHAFLLEHGSRLSLAQRVLGEDIVLYDNPGDFQLTPRGAFEAIAGFDESMVRPFHVDANLAVRLRLQCGAIRSLDAVAIYHCDHARSVTRMNSRDEQSNDFERYVSNVSEVTIASQHDQWGLPDKELEEIQLTAPTQRLAAYLERQPPSNARLLESRYRADTFNSLDYDPEAVSHFVADRLCTLAPETKIAWIGADPRLLAATKMRLDAIGRTCSPPLLCGHLGAAAQAWGENIDSIDALAAADVLVVAFGAEGMARFRDYDRPPFAFSPSEAELVQLDIAGLLRVAATADSARRIVIVNAINNEFERMARQLVEGPLAPFATRLRDGVLRPGLAPFDLRMRDMTVAPGAAANDGAIHACEGHRGDIISGGPYFDLPPALYRATLCYALPRAGLPLLRLKFDLMAFGEQLATATGLAAQAQGELAFDFEIAPAFLAKRGIAPLEIRVSGNGRAHAAITGVRIERKSELSVPLGQLALAHRG